MEEITLFRFVVEPYGELLVDKYGLFVHIRSGKGCANGLHSASWGYVAPCRRPAGMAECIGCELEFGRERCKLVERDCKVSERISSRIKL